VRQIEFPHRTRDAEALGDERVKYGLERGQDSRLSRNEHAEGSPHGEATFACHFAAHTFVNEKEILPGEIQRFESLGLECRDCGRAPRRHGSSLLHRVIGTAGDQEAALSVVGVVELIHGIHRAETPERQARREAFVEELLRGGRLSV
jgi:hypothetical protein